LWTAIQFTVKAPAFVNEYGALGTLWRYAWSFVEPFGTLAPGHAKGEARAARHGRRAKAQGDFSRCPILLESGHALIFSRIFFSENRCPAHIKSGPSLFLDMR
jgi:hypothetical protein